MFHWFNEVWPNASSNHSGICPISRLKMSHVRDCAITVLSPTLLVFVLHNTFHSKSLVSPMVRSTDSHLWTRCEAVLQPGRPIGRLHGRSLFQIVFQKDCMEYRVYNSSHCVVFWTAIWTTDLPCNRPIAAIRFKTPGFNAGCMTCKPDEYMIKWKPREQTLVNTKPW